MVTREQAAGELLARRNAKKGLLNFTRYTFPTYEVNWHHEVMCDFFDRFIAGEIRRLMLFAPPRFGKSELMSRRLPAYILGQNPDARIIAGAYNADFASGFNRDVQRIIDTPAYNRLFPETTLNGSNVRSDARGAYLRNNDIFEIVNHRGFYRGAGVGSGITGLGFDYGLVDDPIKNQAEANSPTYRQNLWDWYRSTFYTRQEKNAGILLTLTRWHEDDLAGRLLELALSDPDADQWVVVIFPAIAEAPIAYYDRRQIGESLWRNKYDEKFLASTQATVGPYVWNALYQQRPKAPEGNRFKRIWFYGEHNERVVPVVPQFARRVRYWDKAGTEGAGAATAGVLLADHEGLTYVEDVVRGHWSAGEREAQIRQTAELDAMKYGKYDVRIYVEQEPGSGGKESADSTVRNLAGFIIEKDPPSGNKDARLEPFAVQAETGNVRIVLGDWNAAYIEEIVAVPYGKLRDQADATAGAFNKLHEEEPLGFMKTKTRWPGQR